NLITICLSLILSPLLSNAFNSRSLYILKHIYKSSDRYSILNYLYVIINVYNLAVTYITAGKNAKANGRYIISYVKSTSMLAIAKLVYPFYKQVRLLPARAMPKLLIYLAAPFLNVSKRWADRNLGINFNLDNKRSKEELYIVYRPLEDTFRDYYLSYLARQDVH
ncbi:hypothetical protein CI102_15025, partial [Trichoderma harzianum]